MKRKSVNCIVAFLAVMMLPLMVGCGIKKKAEAKKLSIICCANLKQLNIGIMMFATDNDGKLPEAKDWEAKIKGYVGSDDAFICPSCNKHYTYWGNGQTMKNYKEPDKTIVFICEGDHLGQTNVAFLDGHVEPLNPAEVNVSVDASKVDGSLPIRK